MAQRRGLPTLLAGGALRRRAIERGLLGESTLWRVAFYAVAARAVWRRLAGSDGEVVFSERLRPGRSVVLTAISGATRKRERAAARAAGASRRAVRKL